MLVVDAALGLHNQDLRIATEAWEHGGGLIVLVNKWDLVEEKDTNTAARGQKLLIEKAPFLEYVPFLYVSALTGQRVRKLLDLILEVAVEREKRVATSEVNRVLGELLRPKFATTEGGRGSKAPLCFPDRHRTARIRHRLESPARHSGVVPALPHPRLPGRVVVQRVTTAPQVHRPGCATVTAGRTGSDCRTCSGQSRRA